MAFFFFLILGVVILVNIIFFLGLLSFFWGAFGGAPFVPTDHKTVQKMLDLAEKIGGKLSQKKVYDLGCGDGRLVFAAAEKGADAVGVDIAWWLVLWAKMMQKFFGKKGKIVHDSLWNVDFSDADVIFLYLLPPMMKRFEAEKWQTLKKGTVIVSHGFALPFVESVLVEKREKNCGRILVYQK